MADSTGGGNLPIWSSGGRKLLYRGPDYQILAVSYTVKGELFTPGKGEVWSPPIAVTRFGIVTAWDLAPDGKRAAVISFVDDESQAPTHPVFLLNFADELQRRAAGAK